jgi:predicted PurR-regulated permease PerM
MASTQNSNGSKESNIKTAADLILRLGVLLFILFLSFKIIWPFLGILIWSLVIAVILFPLTQKVSSWVGNRHKLASLLVTLVFFALLAVPSIWLVNQLIVGVGILAADIADGSLNVPYPPDSVMRWPVIGDEIYKNWTDLAENFGEAVLGFMPHIRGFIEKLLGALGNTGLGILQFALSILIAGVFLMFFREGSITGKKLFRKLAGERGDEFMEISSTTIRNVATGVLGVAILQTALIGLGLVLAQVPLAAVWIVLVLIMCIAQIPAMIFTVPLIIYLFAFMDPFPAVMWAIYFLLMGLIDNILKPIIMGQGSGLPSLVVFLGAIGGFIAFGFLGLFLGAIVLSLSYKLYLSWISYE